LGILLHVRRPTSPFIGFSSRLPVVNKPVSYSYPRYLTAKRSVDERSLNRRVWERFLEKVEERGSRLRILEIGGGVGATVKRIVEGLEGTGIESIHFTFVDLEPENVDAARKNLSTWQAEREGRISLTIEYVISDVFEFASTAAQTFDVIVGQALLDLLPLTETLTTLRPLLDEDGLWYFPIHFDGVTAFEPPLDMDLDAKIERLYHESMTDSQEDKRAGAHTGRRLLTRMREVGATLLEAGSSDWVVFASEEGYPENEDYFLQHILKFVEEELQDHSALDAEVFARWIDERRRQIETGELIYIAHQLDVLAQGTGGGRP